MKTNTVYFPTGTVVRFDESSQEYTTNEEPLYLIDVVTYEPPVAAPEPVSDPGLPFIIL